MIHGDFIKKQKGTRTMDKINTTRLFFSFFLFFLSKEKELISRKRYTYISIFQNVKKKV